jgi:hypothetical protein
MERICFMRSVGWVVGVQVAILGSPVYDDAGRVPGFWSWPVWINIAICDLVAVSVRHHEQREGQWEGLQRREDVLDATGKSSHVYLVLREHSIEAALHIHI